MRGTEIEDKRAPGLPGVPYSAYCQECWEPMYRLWTDKDPHSGLCTSEAATGRPCVRKMKTKKAN